MMAGILAKLTKDARKPASSRIWPSSRTLAGVAITPDTAVTVPTVYACLRYLSTTTGVLPWHAMKPVGSSGSAIASAHPVDWLLWKRPNPDWSSFQFRETLTHWALRWGNGYAEIERDTFGRPLAIWPLHPDRVLVCRALEATEDAAGYPIEKGDLYYEVDNGSGPVGKTNLAARNIFHVRGFGETEVGINVIEYASQSIGWARAAQLFGASFFGNGMNPSGVVTMKKPLKKEGLERLKQEFAQLYKGVRNANKTAFLDNEAEWKPIGTNARDAQLIDVHEFLVTEICRWFGVPPHKVMQLLRATFSNIEHQAIEVVVDSISPWVKRFEDEADYKLFGEQRWRGYFTKINMNALLRGDHQSRMEFYKGMELAGAMSPNEIRALEDMNSLGADGDIHVMQSQLVTIDKIANPPEPAQVQDPTPPPDPAAANNLSAATLAGIKRRLAALKRVPTHAG